jgi:hypothetical protein
MYPETSRAYRTTRVFVLLALALGVGACGPINPNFETLWRPDAENYSIEGAVTKGFSSFPRVGYVQGEGDSTDRGSFKIAGPQGAGIDARGVYVPSALLVVDADDRFKKTFTVRPRYALIRIFAWDDVNRNGVRDLNEQLGGEWELKKEDQRGWSFNAPAWNQFNFSFSR